MTTEDIGSVDRDAARTWQAAGRRSTSHRRSGRSPQIPRGLAQFMRPVVPGLTADILEEIQRQVADYGPHAGWIYQTSTRAAITQAVRYFVDQIEAPATSRAELDETLHRIGRGEAYDGRTLKALRESFQIGAAVAWKRIYAMAVAQGLAPRVLGDLGDALFVFMDSLAEQSALGYHDAQTQLSDAAHQWRGRVLDLILAGSDIPDGELAGHAAAGNWKVPERVAMIAVRPIAGTRLPSARMLHPSTLSKLDCADPVVLHPAPLAGTARDELQTLFAGQRIAIGCAVPTRDAASSLRWARRALDLADLGFLANEPVIDCVEHIGTLWLHAEPLLTDIVCATVLAPLFAEPPNSRRILGETLVAWIETTGGSAPALAAALGRHPQTVRYRLKRLRELFGDQLDRPDRLLEMHLALRASRPQWATSGATFARQADHSRTASPDRTW